MAPVVEVASRGPGTPAEAVAEVECETGRQFCPAAARALLDVLSARSAPVV